MIKDSFLKEHLEFLKENKKTENRLLSLKKTKSNIDTIIVPAHLIGYEEVFIQKNEWYCKKLSDNLRSKLKYIACYQTSPISAITCYSKIANINYDFHSGYFVITFNAPKIIVPIKNNTSMSFQCPRFTTKRKLLKALHLKNVFE